MKSPIDQLALHLKTPKQVQLFLRQMPYNNDDKRPTLYSAEQALKKNKAHCFEAAFVAAAILERHGYEPVVLSIESKDHLDHVLYVFKQSNLWGSIGRSRDQGLHGRAPVYKSIKNLVLSYVEPYVDKTGRITGYQLCHLDEMTCNWRSAKNSIWDAEKYLNQLKHHAIHSSNVRYHALRRSYKKYGPILQGKNWW